MEFKRKERKTNRAQIQPTLNIIITLNANSSRHQNQEKCPAQRYFYFERIFIKWDYTYS